MSPPAPTRRQRSAAASPSGPASRRSPAYFRAWRAARTVPANGAAHSSWTSGAGSWAGSPIGTPAARSRRTASAGRQAAQIGSPSRPQPGHVAGRARSSSRRASQGMPGWCHPALAWRSPARAPSSVRPAGLLQQDPVAAGRPRPVDRAGRQLEGAVGAAHVPHDAAPRGTARRTATTSRVPSAGAGCPTKTQSMAKRMNIMWIPLLPGSHRPASSASDARPIRPRNLAHSESADSMESARTLCRVTFEARTIIDPPLGP